MITLEEFSKLDTNEKRIKAMEGLREELESADPIRKERQEHMDFTKIKYTKGELQLKYVEVPHGKTEMASKNTRIFYDAPRDELIMGLLLLGYYETEYSFSHLWKDHDIAINCENVELKWNKKTESTHFRIAGTIKFGAHWPPARITTEMGEMDGEECAIIERLKDEAYLYIKGTHKKEEA